MTNSSNAGLLGPPIPRVGMLATVRNRRALITAVEPFQGTGPLCNVVTLEYLDSDGSQQEDLLWELEINPELLEPTALPDAGRGRPMPNDEFDALVRATRWTALTPFLDPDGVAGPLSRLPLTSPMHGAIQVEDFQLVPLLKALRMPRVSLLIADDVGLGKTIEAGLILSELFNRRRIRKVLIISPASLCLQWKQEMSDKFCLSFDIVDRESTQALRKQVGIDANPWRIQARCITSYYYLKQPDILEQFRAASKTRSDSPNLPWDLLIVDEAHNLMPPAMGESSDLAKMLEIIAPLCEHKLFLTATPHNGYTRCFSGLLERLDPVRFSQQSEFTEAEKSRIQEVVVRRLKSDINERTNPKRFCERATLALNLDLGEHEKALSSAFQSFRKSLLKLVSSRARNDQIAGTFAVEVLNKRLLSCPFTFAESWRRCTAGMRESKADAAEVGAAKRVADEDTGDDRERESRTSIATQVVGAWLVPYANELTFEITAIDLAIDRLGLTQPGCLPTQDARWNRFQSLIETLLRSKDSWKADERLIVFTEYKTTLDYLHGRLIARYRDDSAVRVLFGGVTPLDRESIKISFNDPGDPVRILVATDTGSEGQNLQETARYLLHYDIPWNPSRLEQRNGRIDRHGQARDVFICHFATDDDPDLKFLAYVVQKVNHIREDLGSTSEIFDEAFERHLIQGISSGSAYSELDTKIEYAKSLAAVPDTDAEDTGEKEAEQLLALKRELDLSPDTLRTTLDVAMGGSIGSPRLEGPDGRGRISLRQPLSPAWSGIVNESLRLPTKGGSRGALPRITFDPLYYIKTIGARPVFRPERDTSLLHLGHPLLRRALSEFARYRFPGANGASRWTARRCSDIPSDADALIVLTVEELAVNELRETYHHWVRTIQISVVAAELGESLPHEPAVRLSLPPLAIEETDIEKAQEIWDEVSLEVKQLVRQLATALTADLKEALVIEHKEARDRELARFASRQGEVSRLIADTTLGKLERELTELRVKMKQGVLGLFDSDNKLLEKFATDKEAEITRRRRHYEEMRKLLDEERRRILEHLLPARYEMRGSAQVFPVAVEIRLPEVKR
jgi:ERCC4-related helicase